MPIIEAGAEMNFHANMRLSYDQVLILAAVLRQDRARLAANMGPQLKDNDKADLLEMLEDWHQDLENCIKKFSAAQRAFKEAHAKDR